ncbi:MAG: PrsW family glutamic-type intramembrane protease [Clostridia bacterium]|nr:PrsW family glutamic-type intramembrane protease [Clostridia bacterium]
MLLAANTVLGIYLAAAIIPAVILMAYIYKKDKVDKEPIGLLCGCLLMGVCAAFASIALEMLGETALQMSPVTANSELYIIVFAFAVVAAVEEGTKLFFLRYKTWNSPDFDCSFDGIVYAVFTSLGFAAFENVKYVFNYGLSVALPRAFLAIPGHMTFAVVMGVFYSKAMAARRVGDTAGVRRNFLAAWVAPVLLHGVYDSCAMLGTAQASAVFAVFIIFMYALAFIGINRESKRDHKF